MSIAVPTGSYSDIYVRGTLAFTNLTRVNDASYRLALIESIVSVFTKAVVKLTEYNIIFRF